MTTFNTAFKNAYSEALKPYGFVKVKGKQPYLARMVGNEILQIITYRNSLAMKPYRDFEILCGIRTVYSKGIHLNLTPSFNTDWLTHHNKIHYYEDNGLYNPDYQSIHTFLYKREDEDSMNKAIQLSLDVTKQWILPVFDRTVDLKTAVDFYNKFRAMALLLYGQEHIGYHDEGLICLKVYDNWEQYADKEKEQHKQYLKDKLYEYEKLVKSERERKYPIHREKSFPTVQELFEKEKKESEKIIKDQISIFQEMMTDPVYHQKALEELEIRKQKNIEALKTYGMM